jgi:cytochrome P450
VNYEGESWGRELGDSFDIHEPSFVLDPYPTYDRLRRECPIMHSERYGGFWLLTREEDVRKAARDWRRFTSSVAGVTAIPIITQRSEPQLPIELDPPLHSKYRALVNPVFSGKRIEELRPRVEAIASALIDELVEQGEGDLVADYAIPLSVGTLAEFTGLPRADSNKWVYWIRRMLDVRNSEDAGRASGEFGRYIDGLIAQRREAPRDDFITILIKAEVDGQRLTDKELHSFCTVLFGAGFETTADALSMSLHYLVEHPEDRHRLTTEPELIPMAVEELLRYGTPIQIFGRNATCEVQMHGETIKEGDVVALSFGSANHDSAAFGDPQRCVLDRSPNRHLAFGLGPHMCLGAPVARLEMAVTLREFARRVSECAIAPGTTPGWKTRGDRRGLATLPVSLAP